MKSVQVCTKEGSFVREYSEEIHGENYVALAKQFAEGKGRGYIVTESETPEATEEAVVEAPKKRRTILK